MESTGSGLLARNLFSVNPELKLNATHAQDQKCEHALSNKISEKRIVRFSKRSKVFLGIFVNLGLSKMTLGPQPVQGV